MKKISIIYKPEVQKITNHWLGWLVTPVDRSRRCVAEKCIPHATWKWPSSTQSTKPGVPSRQNLNRRDQNLIASASVAVTDPVGSEVICRIRIRQAPQDFIKKRTFCKNKSTLRKLSFLKLFKLNFNFNWLMVKKMCFTSYPFT